MFEEKRNPHPDEKSEGMRPEGCEMGAVGENQNVVFSTCHVSMCIRGSVCRRHSK